MIRPLPRTRHYGRPYEDPSRCAWRGPDVDAKGRLGSKTQSRACAGYRLGLLPCEDDAVNDRNGANSHRSGRRSEWVKSTSIRPSAWVASFGALAFDGRRSA